VTFGAIACKSEIIRPKPITFHTPSNTFSKTAPDLIVCVGFSSNFLPDLLLDTKAEASIAVRYPELVNRSEVFTGKFFDLRQFEPALLK
jgi:hypothetical protein